MTKDAKRDLPVVELSKIEKDMARRIGDLMYEKAEKDSQIAELTEEADMWKKEINTKDNENERMAEIVFKQELQIAELKEDRNELKELNVKAWEDKIKLEKEIAELKELVKELKEANADAFRKRLQVEGMI
jgi:chromosome segregation ATPase